MSIFGSIMGKIFHHGSASAASASTAQQQGPAATSSSSSGPSSPGPSSASSSAPASGATASASSTASAQGPVDVEAVLNGMAAKAGQHLDWRHSIVDLLKLLDLDSSLSARKQLAQELHYSGNMEDSAAMNTWLHKQVMTKLAENGGKVPDDLRA